MGKKKRKKKQKTGSWPAINEKKIIDVLQRSKRGALTANSIAKRLGLKRTNRHIVEKFLKELEKTGKIIRIDEKRYGIPERLNLVKGKIQRFKEGFGFLLRDDEPDVFIPPHAMKGAISGDIVLVRMKRRGGRRPEGRVIRIVERVKTKFIGTFRGGRKSGVVIPDEPSLPPEIPVPGGKTGGARDGDKVVFKLRRGKVVPVAEIIEVLGRADDPKIDLYIVLRKYDLPEDFPNKVKKAARRLHREMKEVKVDKGRLDLRKELIFTIDPETAKDFDDAISVKKLKDGYELGVHIADVSYYVTEGSVLDREAFKRGTSVYLIDYVVPMLPHELSSDLASLMPGVDRLTFSVIMRLDRNGRVLSSRFFRSVIKSKARLSYEDAQRLLDGKKLPPKTVSKFVGRGTRQAVAKALRVALELAKKLRANREQRGSIDFDLPEPEFKLLPTGAVEYIRPLERTWSHKLIEEFMILANEQVARYFNDRELPTVYRVHEPPKPEKIKQFLTFASAILNFEPPEVDKVTPIELQRIIKMAEGRPEEPILNYLLLRSMKRAHYSVENRGHFGLASEAYLHFTSPIRRYPDLVVHRLLKSAISGKPLVGADVVARLEEIAVHSTERENVAEEAEFELWDLKKLEFMKDRVGEVFEGIVTHITPYGMFVEIPEYLVEGFVPIETLGGNFEHDQAQIALVEVGGARSFRIGQKVKVVVARVDKSQKRMELVLYEE